MPDAAQQNRRPGPVLAGADAPGPLTGLRVIEVADEQAEYCGMLLAGLGATVIKVEPPAGSPTRAIGPFLDDKPDAEKSLYFWNYNRGKQSVVLDLPTSAGRSAMVGLLETADILIDSSQGRLFTDLGIDRVALLKKFPALILARMTPFGDSGPWKDFKGSDLVHLALGGVMKNCGYDPDPTGHYDLPPIAPQLWHAYHIAGEQLVVGVLAALLHRHSTGAGQDVSCVVHEAVAKNTELDVMSWIMRRAPLFRQTCRHAVEIPNHAPNISHTKDGRWMASFTMSPRDFQNLVPFLRRYNMAADLTESTPAPATARTVPGSSSGDESKFHMLEVIGRMVRAYRYQDLPWREAQDAGLIWAPLRKPHENAMDGHWLMRRTYADVEHPELGRSFRYPTSKWLSTETSWQVGRRAPLLGEHSATVLAELAKAGPKAATVPPSVKPAPARLSARGRPFALQNIRVFDFSWFLASAGGTRFLSALGAEVIKVEWKENPDTRLATMAPVGGRAARAVATAPLKGVTDHDMGGNFNNKNPGKRGMSLNIRHPRGLEIAKELIRMSDIVAEGFTPGVLDRLGLGYDVLKQIKPDIIYVQQSGMGSHGQYGRFRTLGPVAAAFSGASDMSGLPDPAMPTGWGYSYLDWVGAYGFAQALLGALYYRERTGKGQMIDASQCETGLFLNGVATLDWSVNGRAWTRIGNRSPYKPAAPHGAYRCKGEDRWIAIACTSEAEWIALTDLADRRSWRNDRRFATLEARLAHQDALDALMNEWTGTLDDYDCMLRLQAAGVPAGVCQDAADRCDRDPQLAALEWLTEVTGTKIGRWPVGEVPVKLDATPAYAGGMVDRGAPCYAEDNNYVLGDLLGLSAAEIEKLAADGII